MSGLVGKPGRVMDRERRRLDALLPPHTQGLKAKTKETTPTTPTATTTTTTTTTTIHNNNITPSPPTKSLGFRGFDASKLLILRGGNSHVR